MGRKNKNRIPAPKQKCTRCGKMRNVNGYKNLENTDEPFTICSACRGRARHYAKMRLKHALIEAGKVQQLTAIQVAERALARDKAERDLRYAR